MFVIYIYIFTGFPPFKEHKIQELFQDFQGPSYAYSRTEMCKKYLF